MPPAQEVDQAKAQFETFKASKSAKSIPVLQWRKKQSKEIDAAVLKALKEEDREFCERAQTGLFEGFKVEIRSKLAKTLRSGPRVRSAREHALIVFEKSDEVVFLDWKAELFELWRSEQLSPKVAVLSAAWAMHQSAKNLTAPKLTKTEAQRSTLRSDSASKPADRVDCSVFGRSEVRSAQAFEVQVLLHRRDDLIKAARLAQRKEQGVNRRGFASLTASIPRGATVDLLMESESFIIQNPLQEAIWHGAPVCIPFTLELPSEPTEASAMSRLHVSLDGTPSANWNSLFGSRPRC
jgi:hypothetical protein